MKTPLFMDRVLIFPFPSTKTAISMDNKKPSAKLEFTGQSNPHQQSRVRYPVDCATMKHVSHSSDMSLNEI